MFKQDKNCFGGGLCIYVKKNIASKQLNLHLDKGTAAIYLEINIRLRKWLIVGLQKPPNLDSYENITLLGDFNMTPKDKKLQHFTDTLSIENLINEPTRFKGSPSCIDLAIHNRKSYFKNTCVTVIGINDFHKLTAVSL